MTLFASRVNIICSLVIVLPRKMVERAQRSERYGPRVATMGRGSGQ